MHSGCGGGGRGGKCDGRDADKMWHWKGEERGMRREWGGGGRGREG